MSKKHGTIPTSPDGGTHALLARAASAGDERVEKQALQALRDEEKRWSGSGAVVPRYPLASLLGIVDRSSILPQCLEAMADGIDGWGHTFEPTVDPSAPDLDDKIRASIVCEREADARERAREEGKEDWTADYTVTDEEVKDRRETIERQAPIQRQRAEAWFESAATGAPFVELRRQMRHDQYAVGHGVLEVVRDETGDLAQIAYVPAHTILPISTQPPPVEVDVEIPVSPISTRTVRRWMKYDVYLQQVGTRKLYFKSFGDERAVSQASGAVYEDDAAMQRKEGKRGKKAVPASEILYFPLHTPMSSAGEIQWGGQIPNVLGLRAAEEVNYSWFDDKCIPPGAWVITGAMLDQNLRAEVEDHIRTKIRGRVNYHTPLIIELKSQPGARGEKVEVPQVKWLSFRDDLKKDATHQEYTQSARDNIRSAFRLPRMLTGDVQADLTRANAYASLEFANTHVFSAPRRVFDWIVNETIMRALGVTLWKFVSRGPDLTDTEALSQATDVFAERGGLTPADVRAVAARALPVPLAPFPADATWAGQPLALTLAGFAAEQMGVSSDRAGVELLHAFGPEGTTAERDVAHQIFKEFFERAGYDLVRVATVTPDEGAR